MSYIDIDFASLLVNENEQNASVPSSANVSRDKYTDTSYTNESENPTQSTLDVVLSAKTKAIQAFRQGQYDTALRFFQHVLELMKHDDQLITKDNNIKHVQLSCQSNCAECCLKLNRLSNALEFCERALELDKTDVKTCCRFARTVLAMCESNTVIYDSMSELLQQAGFVLQRIPQTKYVLNLKNRIEATETYHYANKQSHPCKKSNDVKDTVSTPCAFSSCSTTLCSTAMSHSSTSGSFSSCSTNSYSTTMSHSSTPGSFSSSSDSMLNSARHDASLTSKASADQTKHDIDAGHFLRQELLCDTLIQYIVDELDNTDEIWRLWQSSTLGQSGLKLKVQEWLDNAKFTHSIDKIDENVLILFHGFGDTPGQVFQLGHQMALPQTAVLSLAAPFNVPYVDNGYMWYTDIDMNHFNWISATESHPIRQKTIRCTQSLLCALFHAISSLWKLPSRRIHVLGYGQGATISFAAGLHLAASERNQITELGSIAAINPSYCLDPFLYVQESIKDGIYRQSETRILVIFPDIEGEEQNQQNKLWISLITKKCNVRWKFPPQICKHPLKHGMIHTKTEIKDFMKLISDAQYRRLIYVERACQDGEEVLESLEPDEAIETAIERAYTSSNGIARVPLQGKDAHEFVQKLHR